MVRDWSTLPRGWGFDSGYGQTLCWELFSPNGARRRANSDIVELLKSEYRTSDGLNKKKKGKFQITLSYINQFLDQTFYFILKILYLFFNSSIKFVYDYATLRAPLLKLTILCSIIYYLKFEFRLFG